MEYVYAALLLEEAGKKIEEKSIMDVVKAAGMSPTKLRQRPLVASLKGVDIKEVIKNAQSRSVQERLLHQQLPKRRKKKTRTRRSRQSARKRLQADCKPVRRSLQSREQWIGSMDVYVDKPRCTGCQHCKDVCPVACLRDEGHGRQATRRRRRNGTLRRTRPSGRESSRQSIQTSGPTSRTGTSTSPTDNDGTSGGISVAVNGASCILCQACLIECEGECIHITDDSGTKYSSVYK